MNQKPSSTLSPGRPWQRVALQDRQPREARKLVLGGTRRTKIRSLRRVAVWLHRYLGLSTAVFLIVAGVTGTALTFYEELDAMVNPNLLHVPRPRADVKPQDPLELRQALQAKLPGAVINQLDLRHTRGKASTIFVTYPKAVLDHGDDEFFVDPYTGEVLGSRRWGDILQGSKNLMPFIYRLHSSLALGTVGEHLFGIVALLWTIDCFVGAFLTFPVSNPERRSSAPTDRRFQLHHVWSWLSRWRKSWMVRSAKLFSAIFTWHRAGGLWLWSMLLVFAWSAVGLNLNEVYSPVMRQLFTMEPTYENLPTLAQPHTVPALSWQDARHVGRALVRERSNRDGFTVLEERRLGYFAERGLYRYSVRSTLDVSTKYPNTTVWFDGDSGQLVAFEAPTGRYAGDTVTTWLLNLHWGTVSGAGIAYRVFVAFMGLAITGLSVTGVWIWWRKRSRTLDPERLTMRRPITPSWR